MLPPTYFDTLADSVVELWEQAETDILRDMAARIAATDFYIPVTEWQESKLREMGMCRSEIVKRLSGLTGKSEAEIKAIMKTGCTASLQLDSEIYKFAGVTPKSLPTAAWFRAQVAAGIKKTNGVFRNLTKTTANTATKQFEDALDRAYMQVYSGGFSSEAAIQSAVRSLSENGIGCIRYPSGHVDYIEVATRRAVVTGVNQTAASITYDLADELGCDLVEVSAHHGARPTHAEWQGQVYTRSGKTPGYDNFIDATGYGSGDGLCGWNCRHSFFPYFEGTARTYSRRRLDEINSSTITYRGRTMSEYEATQYQRGIERGIRKWKREYEAMAAAGQPTGRSAAKIAEWNAKHSDFIRETGLKVQHGRTQLPGFGRAQASAASAATRKFTAQKTVKTVSRVASNSGTIKTTTLSQFYDAAHVKAVEGALAKAPAAIQGVWNAFEGDIKVLSTTTRGARYSPASQGIYVDIASDAAGRTFEAAYETTFHELGHLFDYAASIRAGGSKFKAISETYKSGIFGQTIRDEAAEHVKSAWDRLKAEALANGVDASKIRSTVTKAQAYAAVEKEVRKLSPIERANISDMFEGATKGKVACGFGHGKSYWTGRDVCKEAFAEMYSSEIVNSASLDVIRQYFPRSYTIFTEIIEGIAKGTI